jgi:hypothetical protein
VENISRVIVTLIAKNTISELVGNGRDWWNCALIDAVFSLRFSSTFKKRGAKKSFALRKRMTNQIKQQFFQFENFGSNATAR